MPACVAPLGGAGGQSVMRLRKRAGWVGVAVVVVLCAGVGSAAASGSDQWRVVYESHTAESRTTGSSFYVVTAPGRRDAWAAGSTTSYRSGRIEPDFVHWNGSRWQAVSIPGTAGFEPLVAQSTSPGDVWIFGSASSSDDEALLLAGGSWHVLHTPPFGVSVAVLGSSNVWMIGQAGSCDSATEKCTTQLVHWNGQAWSSYIVGTLIEGLAGWGSHVWAVGRTDLRGSASTGVVVLYQWSQGVWRRFGPAQPRSAVAGEIAAGPRGQLWLLDYPVHRTPELRYWTGRQWKQLAIPRWADPPALIDGPLTYDLRSGVWLGPYVHWTGKRWVNAYQIAALGSFSIQAFAPIPGSSSLWGAGEDAAGRMIALHGPLP
jgi:hypothetical protein